MIRILIEVVVPLLAPTAAYLVWLYLTRNRPRPPGGRGWHYVGLLAAGIGLMIASLVYWALHTGDPPGGVYVPPHMENGRLVPGHVER